ncbi:MAG: hypothetical protein L0241_00080 [Planctomycetia bacterium]|nr:hypothetical protein [Planctomycetia bacterium]
MSIETSKSAAKPKFRVGEWVAYTSGISRHVAEVIEDVGPVGARGRRFYRLREPIWYGEPVEYELPETSLEPATHDDLKRRYPPEQQPPSPDDLPQSDYE